jgi:NAD kinase
MRSLSRNKIKVVVKDSKVDYDCRRLQLSGTALLAKYRAMGYAPEKIKSIWESHDLQQLGKELIATLFPAENILNRDQFVPEALANASAVISFGGDNHFQYLARYLTNTPIIGINADPPRSEGALTQITVNQLPMVLDLLEMGRYRLEEWTRLAVKLNGKTTGFPILCEAFVGEHKVENMSRLNVVIGGTKFVHKGSGMLLYTGSGSSGWAYSIDHVTFPKTAKHLRYVFMNPYVGKLAPVAKNHNAYFPKDQRCTVISLNDAEGVIVLDALETLPFPEGAKAEFIKGQSLRVIQPLV